VPFKSTGHGLRYRAIAELEKFRWLTFVRCCYIGESYAGILRETLFVFVGIYVCHIGFFKIHQKIQRIRGRKLLHIKFH